MFERNLHKVELPVNRLKIGMFVAELDRPWLDSPFLLQGFEITNEEDIRSIQNLCDYVYVDVKKSRSMHHRTQLPKTNPQKRQSKLASLFKKRNADNHHSTSAGNYKDKVSVVEELDRAGKAYNNTKAVVNDILASLLLGRDIKIQQVREVVNECVDSILNNKDSLLWFTLIKNKDKYISEHCLNVAILSIAFGRHLGLPEQDLKNLGLCALLHDIGKIKVPSEILNKEDFFTQEEFEIIKKHALYGRDFLMSQSGIYPGAIDVAYAHHEKVDGTGYPRGLKGSQIPHFAKIVAITDAYDAITSDRVYQNSRSTLEAQKILLDASGSHFDVELTQRFTQWLAIYPPGTIIEMSNGEVGIVLSVNPKFKLKPKVILLLDEHKETQEQRIADLSKMDLDRNGQTYMIKTSHPNNSFGIDIVAYQKRGLIDKKQGAGPIKKACG